MDVCTYVYKCVLALTTLDMTQYIMVPEALRTCVCVHVCLCVCVCVCVHTGTLISLDMTQYIEVPEADGTYTHQITTSKVALTRAFPIAPQVSVCMYV